MTQSIPALEEQLVAAQNALNDALANGADTSKHHRAIVRLEGQIAAAANAERAAVAEQSRIEAEAIEKVAIELSSGAYNEITARVGLSPLATDSTALYRCPEIDIAARIAAQAQFALSRAESEHSPQREKIDALRKRLNAKRASADAIHQRRLEGDEREGDAAELSLLQADAKALENLVNRAVEARTADNRPAARAALDSALSELERLKNQTVFRVLLDRVGELESVFVDAWRQMVEAGRVNGNLSPWSVYQASPEMKRAVTGQIVPGYRGGL